MGRLETTKKRPNLSVDEKYQIFIETAKSDEKGCIEDVLRKYDVHSRFLQKIKKVAENGAKKALREKRKYNEHSSKDEGRNKVKELKGFESLVYKLEEEIKLKDTQIKLQKSINDDLNTIIEGLKYTRDKLIQAEKLSSLRQFTSDVCHEIRNPLTSMGGFVRRLNNHVSFGTKEKRYCEVIISEVERLEKILKNVLTFSTDTRLNINDHNINEIIDVSIKIYEDISKGESIHIIKSLNDIPKIMIDKEHIRHVIDNLLSNAIDSISYGGTITISTNKEFLNEITYVTVKITDTGGGISEDRLSMIFDPFFTTKAVGYSHGTGLGLSTSRIIMEEHNGFIKAESKIGKGSIFTLYFPYQSKEELSNVPCWEFMECGRDNNTEIRCPAHPFFGRSCWAVAGTYCVGKMQGSYAQKIDNCRRCTFYRKIKNKEV